MTKNEYIPNFREFFNRLSRVFLKSSSWQHPILKCLKSIHFVNSSAQGSCFHELTADVSCGYLGKVWWGGSCFHKLNIVQTLFTKWMAFISIFFRKTNSYVHWHFFCLFWFSSENQNCWFRICCCHELDIIFLYIIFSYSKQYDW